MKNVHTDGLTNTTESARVAYAIEPLDMEMSAADHHKALRLYCRWMIRAYQQDRNDQGLGLLSKIN